MPSAAGWFHPMGATSEEIRGKCRERLISSLAPACWASRTFSTLADHHDPHPPTALARQACGRLWLLPGANPGVGHLPLFVSLNLCSHLLNTHSLDSQGNA